MGALNGSTEANSELRKICTVIAYRLMRKRWILFLLYPTVSILMLLPAFYIITLPELFSEPKVFFSSAFAMLLFSVIIQRFTQRIFITFFIVVGLAAVGLLSALLWIALDRAFGQIRAGEVFDGSGSSTSDVISNLQESAELLQAVTISALMWLLLLATLTVVVASLSAIVNAAEVRASPRTTAFFAIAQAAAISHDEAEFRKDSSRRAAIQHLEEAARCLERGLEPAYSLPSANMNTIVHHRMRSSATAIREKQVWVALPAQQTAGDLLAFCLDMLNIIATGKYDHLPCAEVEPTAKNQLIKATIAFSRVIVGAVLPISLVVALDAMNILKGPVSVPVYVVASLLAAVSIITLIDPGFTGRIAAAKDVTTLFRDSASLK
ncbi:hypothetical protein [Actinoplanes sp. NPDC026623]|uniref:hypothetical protein n=1 Tax=Actinoplanes sp. NPDC026623 TaxID=3155610 RepID=UPI0033E4D7CB